MGEQPEPKTQVIEPEAPVTVRVDNIEKKFGSFKAINSVSFQVRKGEVLGFLGPNGAGKTTAMRILAGFFPPSNGKVWIDSEDLFKDPPRIKKKIGYLPENIYLYRNMQVSEFMKFVTDIKGISRKKRKEEYEEKIELCGLQDVQKRLIAHLSKGYRQRLGLAQALVGDPELLLLDEPTSGLDPKQITDIRNLIRQLGRDRTLILSTHILPEVSMVCDRVLILNEGKVIASGTADELQAELQARHEVYVLMGDRHRKEDAVQIFKSIEGVEKVRVIEEAGDRVNFSLAVKQGVEPRPEITRLFVEANIPLLEIRAASLSLEEIFLKLVVKEES